MKKSLLAGIFGCVLAISCAGLAGCAQAAAEDVNADVPEGAAPLMPVSHDGRYEALASEGCYGCHGASETAEVLLATATPLPADHYVDGNVYSYTVEPLRAMCFTCHGQASAAV